MHFNTALGAVEDVQKEENEDLNDINSDGNNGSDREVDDDEDDAIQISTFDKQSKLLLKKFHQEATELL